MNIEFTLITPFRMRHNKVIRFTKVYCGDIVKKVTGDYKFKGEVVSIFRKANSAQERVVVENKDGILHIFNPSQLRKL